MLPALNRQNISPVENQREKKNDHPQFGSHMLVSTNDGYLGFT